MPSQSEAEAEHQLAQGRTSANEPSSHPVLTPPAVPLALMVGGAPRSGTTLVADLLNENPAIAIMAEYSLEEFLENLGGIFSYEAALTAMQQSTWNKQVDLEKGPPTYTPYGGHVLAHTIRFPQRERLAEIAAGVIRASLNKPFAHVVGSKVPTFPLSSTHMTVRRLFPRTFYLFIVRNPLEQANSAFNRRNRASMGIDVWHHSEVADHVAEYRAIARAIYTLARRFPDDVYIIKYNDLIKDQRATMAKVNKFLGLPPFEYPALATAQRGARNILTEDETTELRKSFGGFLDAWPTLRLTGPGKSTADSLGRLFEPPPVRHEPISPRREYLGSGWSGSEPDGVWSESEIAGLVFGPASPEPRLARIDVLPYLPSETSRFKVRISLNGTVLFDGHLCAGVGPSGPNMLMFPNGRAPTTIWLSGVTMLPDRANYLEFGFSGLTSPSADGGASSDTRLLGVKLSAISFPPA